MAIYRLAKGGLSVKRISKRKVRQALSDYYQDVDLILCAIMDGHVIETPFAIYAVERHKLDRIHPTVQKPS